MQFRFRSTFEAGPVWLHVVPLSASNVCVCVKTKPKDDEYCTLSFDFQDPETGFHHDFNTKMVTSASFPCHILLQSISLRNFCL